VAKLTPMQRLLKTHLSELGIKTVPEFRFCLERRYRFDLYSPEHRIGFEVNGTFQGLHGPRYKGDNEKINLAQVMGFRVLVFTNKEVERGHAKAWLKEHLDL
jgi:very-short-patch-repair endonuclease